MHLDTIQRMLPIFHANGHTQYGKYLHLYLQDMFELQNQMDPNEYQKFIKYFNCRRTEKFWSGLSHDQTIELYLMRQLKVKGGLFARGLTDEVIAKWLSCLIILIEISEALEIFCGFKFNSSDQHVDSRGSQIERDVNDMTKLIEFFKNKSPFPQSDQLV